MRWLCCYRADGRQRQQQLFGTATVSGSPRRPRVAVAGSAPAVTSLLLLLLVLVCSSCAAAASAGSEAAVSSNAEQQLQAEQLEQAVRAQMQQPAKIEDELLAADGSGPAGKLTQSKFMKAFIASVSMILVSEIGDKTFFIAAIMAMKHDRLHVFGAAIGALICMTVLSAIVGVALPAVLSPWYTHYASALLFAFFGVKLLYEAATMNPSHASEELEEVESELKQKDEKTELDAMEAGTANGKTKPLLGWRRWLCCSQVVVTAFTMTFLAEWGDRSQISTFALATSHNPYGVTLGGIVGHAICTGAAVLGGRLLATRISARTVPLLGGLLFLIFAVWNFAMPPENL